MAAALSEPLVLASTKELLYPDAADTDSETYVVADTQFAKDAWLPGAPIPAEVKRCLSPFNHIKVGTGYPDLVAVGLPSQGLQKTARRTSAPLTVIESKGYTASSDPKIKEGIVQAHDRLTDANVAFTSAPKGAITHDARSLARELNVGLIGVTSDGSARVLETPRLVGTGSEAGGTDNTVQLRATYSSVGRKAFNKNNPKNYLTYPICVYADGDTEELYKDHVIQTVGDGMRGARALGLITGEDNNTLTMAGREVVRFALEQYNNMESALNEIASWHNMHGPFIKNEKEWGLLARSIVTRHPMMQRIIETVERLQTLSSTPPTLPDVVEEMYRTHPADAIEIFIRADDDSRERVLADVDELNTAKLTDASIYSAQLFQQIKSVLHHVGILTEGGTSRRSKLTPTDDVWALQTPLGTK